MSAAQGRPPAPRRPDAAGRIKAALRILMVALLALPLIPVQALAVRRGWRLAGQLPAFFHRRVLRIIGVRVTQHGAMDTRRPLLILANHVSWLDIVVIGAAAPLSFVAKQEVGTWPVIGLFARLQRSFFIDRAQRSRTGAATRDIAQRLQAGDAIVLFAEGTTSDGLRVLPFRSALVGAARDALGETDTAWVQPLAISYVRRDGLPVGRQGMPQLAWPGDVELVPHLMGILAGGTVDVRLDWGEAIAFTRNDDRKRVTRDAEAIVRRLGEAARRGPAQDRCDRA